MSEIKQDTLSILQEYGYSLSEVKAMKIEYSHWSREEEDNGIKLLLKVSDSDQVKQDKFDQMEEIIYDSGYGSSYFDNSIIWMNDGSWFTRGEYDGAEWWEHNKLPDIPSELL